MNFCVVICTKCGASQDGVAGVAVWVWHREHALTCVPVPFDQRPLPPAGKPWSPAPLPERHPRELQGHGTLGCYQRGCHCDECVDAMRTYYRGRYTLRRALTDAS